MTVPTREVVLIIAGVFFLMIALLKKFTIYKVIDYDINPPFRIVFLVLGLAFSGFGLFPEYLLPPRTAGANEAQNQVNPISLPPIESPQVSSPNQVASVSPDAKITILKPHNGSTVAAGESVSGTYNPAFADDIWVIVWPEKAYGKGWPQSEDAENGAPCNKVKGEWSVYSTFGGPVQYYEIAVYTATPAASKAIGDIMRTWFRHKEYKGMLKANLPEGLTERLKLRVRKTRK